MRLDTIASRRLSELLADSSIPPTHRALWALLAQGEFSLVDFLSLDVRDVTGRKLRAAGPSRYGLTEMLVPERASALLREIIGDRSEGAVFTEGGRAMSRESASAAARQHAGCSIHAFRNSIFRHSAVE